MIIGRYELRIFEDGEDITNLHSHDVLSFFPITPGVYGKTIFPHDDESYPDSATLVFNNVLELFREVDPAEIMNHYDIQIFPAGTNSSLPRYYLANIMGSPYLVNDWLGQLLIPLGKSNETLALESASYLDRAMASVLLEDWAAPHDWNIDFTAFSVHRLYDAFIRFGLTVEHWETALSDAQRGNRISIQRDADGFKTSITKVTPFSWHPAKIVEAMTPEPMW